MSLPQPNESATAIVTGASSGIGAEFARSLARRGHGVTLVARREKRLETLAAELADTHDIRAEVVAADLTDAGARRDLIATVADRGLSPSILVNNAGFTTMGKVHEGDPEAELRMVELNVAAVSHLCALVLPGMVERGTGAICNVSSMAAFQPIPGLAGYAGSKSFVKLYTEGLSGELRGSGVSVAVLCPGPVDTEFTEAAGMEGDFTDMVPPFMFVPAADVAEDAVVALERGRVVVVPGPFNKIGVAMSAAIPSAVTTQIISRLNPLLR